MSRAKKIVQTSRNGNGPTNRLADVLGPHLNGNGNVEKSIIDVPFSLKTPVQGNTPGQKNYIKTMQHNDITIVTGDAGTGKTRLSVGIAADYLAKGLVERIIFVRPAVNCDEDLGFLPGELQSKLGPYLVPAYDELFCFFTTEQITALTSGKRPKIEGVSLGMMKGRSFRNSFVLLDESQDATYKQLKMFLTRIGEGTKMVIAGDVTQSDRFDHEDSTPLRKIMNLLEGVDGIGFARLTPADIQRHPKIGMILERL